MATKAQRFREELDRLKHNKPKKPTTSPKARYSHNDAQRVEKKAVYTLEPGARPSRKSTRGGANHVKHDSALRITARVRSTSPEARATRGPN